MGQADQCVEYKKNTVKTEKPEMLTIKNKTKQNQYELLDMAH